MKTYKAGKKAMEGVDYKDPDFSIEDFVRHSLQGLDVKKARRWVDLIRKAKGRHIIFDDNDTERMERALDLLDYEVTTCQLDKSRLIRKKGGEWKHLDNAIMVKLMGEFMCNVMKIGAQGKLVPLEFSKQKREDILLDLALRNKPHNATLEFIKLCGEWDGEERIDNLMQRLFMVGGAPDSYPSINDTLLTRTARWLFIGVIHRALHPGCEGVDEIPVLIGPQGVGKDVFLESLLPKLMGVKRTVSISEWRGFDIKKRLSERMIGKHIAKLAEMSDIRNADVAFVKDFISETSDTIRRSYRPDAEDIPRLSLFVGTSNKRRPLPKDSSGNRRFIPVFVGGNAQPTGSDAYDHVQNELDLMQLWAEAKVIYDSQEDKMSLFQMIPNSDMRSAIRKIQRDVSLRNETYDDIVVWMINGYTTEMRRGVTMLRAIELVEQPVPEGKMPRGRTSEYALREAMESRLEYVGNEDGSGVYRLNDGVDDTTGSSGKVASRGISHHKQGSFEHANDGHEL